MQVLPRRWLRRASVLTWLLWTLLVLCGLLVTAGTTVFALLHARDGQITTRVPPTADYGFMGRSRSALPPLRGGVSFQLDLRHCDLSAADLREDGDALLKWADFDERTRWPDTDRMPGSFDPRRTLELGKNPGLGVRGLHRAGITGRGVGIGIIDGPLLLDHVEYADRIRLYEEVEPVRWDEGGSANMHAAAVVSIAAGKTVGVAPEAEVYFVGATLFDLTPHNLMALHSGVVRRDFRWFARAVRRLLEVNETLPPERRIRVISTSVGWDSSEAGYDEMTGAVRAAEAAGILVVSSSISDSRGLFFHGLGRDPTLNPDQPSSYGPGRWWTNAFRRAQGDLSRAAGWRGRPDVTGRILLVPMDSRTTAAPTGPTDYVFYRVGGWSWSIPYIAGLYALAVQVRPDVTPEEFWRCAAETGDYAVWDEGGQSYRIGPIVNAARLVYELRDRAR